jgi:hypothetical protein
MKREKSTRGAGERWGRAGGGGVTLPMAENP